MTCWKFIRMRKQYIYICLTFKKYLVLKKIKFSSIFLMISWIYRDKRYTRGKVLRHYHEILKLPPINHS